MPTLFLAPTAEQARRAAWEFLRGQASQSVPTPRDFLDPPLIFTESGASEFRALSRENAPRTAFQTAPAPRLVRAEAYFARAVASLWRRRALSGADRLWVLQNAAKRAAALPQNAEWETELSRIATHRETLRGAARHIAGLRRADFSQFPTATGAQWLNALLSIYNARLETLEAFDFEAAPALFPLAIARSRAFSHPRALLIDDLTVLSPALQRGLGALLERAEIAVATLVCGGDEPAQSLESALAFWRARGADIRRVGDWKAAGARVASRVLGSETPCEAPCHLFLTSAHTPREEMERVAAHIRAQVEAGARPDDFALGIADFGAYEADARYAFGEYGVPLDWAASPPLAQSPLVRALKRALDPQLPLNVHALHDVFGDGTLRWQCEEKVLDARRLRAAGLAARHPELEDLEATRTAFERKRALLTREARHDDAPARARIESALLAGDLELVAQFEVLRAPLKTPCGAGVWQARVLEIANRLTAHWEESDSAAGTRAQSDLARFQAAVEAVATRARGWDDEEGDTSRGALEWMGWLELEIESVWGEKTEIPRGGVKIGGIDAGNFGARATFWCGLSERAWPHLAPPNAATRELEQILNAHLAPPLGVATLLLARGASENRALYLSHARYLESQETPASPLLDDLRAAFPGAKWPQLSPAPPQNGTRRGVLRAWNAHLATENPAPLETEIPLRALAQMRAARREIGAVGVYDGVLGARGRELMECTDQSQSGGARLSGSDLEFYARCPLRYFFERVLRLRHAEREGDDIDARAAGTLVHEIARLALPALSGALQSGDFETGLQILAKIAREQCESLPIRPILREAEWRRLMGFDGQSGPLALWLRLEIARGGGAWLPAMRPMAESKIGIEGVSSGLEHRFEIELGGHAVKGFIDRIDICDDGAHLAILDYKTGDIAGLPSWKAGDSGLHFQLAIYALAIRKLAFENAPPRLAMAYLSLKRAKIARGIGQEGVLGKGCSGAKPLDDAAFEAWLEDVSARAARIGDLRAAGTFNLSMQAPKDAKCGNCASKTLCGQHAPTQAARFDEHRGSPYVYLPVLRAWDA